MIMGAGTGSGTTAAEMFLPSFQNRATNAIQLWSLALTAVPAKPSFGFSVGPLSQMIGSQDGTHLFSGLQV